mgnify:CR=1 FL=1
MKFEEFELERNQSLFNTIETNPYEKLEQKELVE